MKTKAKSPLPKRQNKTIPPTHPRAAIFCAMAGILACGLFAAYLACHVIVNRLERHECGNAECRLNQDDASAPRSKSERNQNSAARNFFDGE